MLVCEDDANHHEVAAHAHHEDGSIHAEEDNLHLMFMNIELLLRAHQVYGRKLYVKFQSATVTLIMNSELYHTRKVGGTVDMSQRMYYTTATTCILQIQ